MAVYNFSLLTGFEFTGVDTAMCFRAGIFREMGCEAKLVFTKFPGVDELRFYTGQGLGYDQILVVHSYFTDIRNLEPAADARGMADSLAEMLECTEEERQGKKWILKKDGRTEAVLHLTEDGASFYVVDYYHGGLLAQSDYYAGTGRYASAFYGMIDGRISERLFYNRDGSVALTQLFRDGSEYNVFPSGDGYNNEQLFALFVQKLNLTKDDLVILDRPFRAIYARPLLACHERTNIAAVIHSEHFNRIGFETHEGRYLNNEYWYWCKYSGYIHTMVVGTGEQKAELEKTMARYGFEVPDIRVIPPMCLQQLRYPEEKRKRKSVVCVSRLNERKKINWTILAAVRAHRMDPEITLDIYGKSVRNDYMEYLNRLIAENNASDYISLKGWKDVTEIYRDYEVFLTTSLWETFGITLLEAAGSGLAMVGLDVRYGNRLFIEDGRNGYLVPYDPAHMREEYPSEIDELAQRIIAVLSDEEKLAAFSARSYEIAKRHLSVYVKQKWYDMLPR